MPQTPIRRRALHEFLGTLLAALLLGPACGGPGANGGSDFPSGSPPFHVDYDSTLAAARARGVPAVLVFSASWCPPCRANKADVYPSPAVQRFHADFVWAYLDADQPRNRPTLQRFGVSGIPHIQFVDPAGEPLGPPVVGATSPESFARDLEGALRLFRG